LIKFQGRNLPQSNKELGHPFTDVKDMWAKVPCPVLTPKPLSIIPGCQRDIIPKSLLVKTKIWKPGELAHHSMGNTLMPPDPVDASTVPTPTPSESPTSKDAQVNLQDPGEDVKDSGEVFLDALDDFQHTLVASKTKSKVWISMDYSKTPMDTPNMHGVPKEEQLDLLDPGEQPVDSGEHFHGSSVAFQDADLLDCHQEFDRITFVENIHIGISDLSMSPKLATSIIWKLKNKDPPSIIPELQKDVIPKLLPIESKVW
jgi:hypothetical protein